MISGVGALCTYTRLLPSSAVSAAMRLNLVNLSESRPKILVLVWLKGAYVCVFARVNALSSSPPPFSTPQFRYIFLYPPIPSSLHSFFPSFLYPLSHRLLYSLTRPVLTPPYILPYTLILTSNPPNLPHLFSSSIQRRLHSRLRA